MPVGPNSKLGAASGVEARETSDGLIVVSLETGSCWHMNRTGAALWQGLTSGRSIRDLAPGLALRFEVDRSTFESDAIVLADRLMDLGLLTARDPAP